MTVDNGLLRSPAGAREAVHSDVERPVNDQALRGMRRFTSALALLLAGYALFDHAMAWTHIPGTPIYVGEIVLFIGAIGMTTAALRIRPLILRSPVLVLLVIYMAWGAMKLVFDVGQYGVDALRDSAIWYYGAFSLLIVLSTAARRLDWWIDRYAGFVPALVVWLPVALALGVLFSDSSLLVPDSPTSIFSHHPSLMAVHGILAIGFMWTLGGAYSRIVRIRLPLTLVALAVVLATGLNSRAALVSSGLGALLLIFGLRQTRARLAWLVTGLVVSLASVGLLFDVEITWFTNDRVISVEQFVDNMASIVSPDLVEGDLAANRTWRTDLWGNAITGLNRDHPLTGYGFGINLREKFGIQDDDPPSRHPHSSHINTIARMGWIGALLWALLWGTWFWRLARARSEFLRTGRDNAASFALLLMVGAIMYLAQAAFNEVMEGPQSGIWVWAIFGFGACLALVHDAMSPGRAKPR